MNDVTFPEMRENLKAFTESLADEGYQRRVWVNGERPPSHDSFDDVLHWYFDDTDLAKAPEDCVGFYLRDYSEVEHVRKVVHALDLVLDEVAAPGSGADVVNAPHWPQVVAAARSLLTVMNTLDDTGA